ncbi:GNAT family N-acetyltransferase [Oerskovia sp. NPDC056781]|uniref:GNAT family N-acetyltransferase n=1 Tax=Oerskovia sp. NPDC056781 TaxID=3345942 RepID=UPI0036704393
MGGRQARRPTLHGRGLLLAAGLVRGPVLDEELGPLDEEWLEYVLADETGEQLVVLADGAPVATVGLVWANGEHGAHVITDIAVDPARRGAGLGRTAVGQVVAHVEREAPGGWAAHVVPENLAAFAFFSALGWDHTAEADPQDEDGMHTFVTHATSRIGE